MQTFVINYEENKISYAVLWNAKSQGEAILSFWKSYDAHDRKSVSNVKIFKLVEIVCDTNNPFVYEGE